jgi:hypothetical protein
MSAFATPPFAGVLQSAVGTGTVDGVTVAAGPTLNFELRAGEQHGQIVFDGAGPGTTITVYGTANYGAPSPAWFPVAWRFFSTNTPALNQPILLPQTVGQAIFLPNLAHCNGLQLSLAAGGPVNVRAIVGSFYRTQIPA